MKKLLQATRASRVATKRYIGAPGPDPSDVKTNPSS